MVHCPSAFTQPVAAVHRPGLRYCSHRSLRPCMSASCTNFPTTLCSVSSGVLCHEICIPVRRPIPTDASEENLAHATLKRVSASVLSLWLPQQHKHGLGYIASASDCGEACGIVKLVPVRSNFVQHWRYRRSGPSDDEYLLFD